MTDIEIITAFIETGLVLREWVENRLRHRLVESHGHLQVEVMGFYANGWVSAFATQRRIANEIRRQLQEDCDKAGVNVAREGDPSQEEWYMVVDWWGKWLQEDGTFKLGGAGTSPVFETRPEGWIAACVALEKEK